MQEIVKVIVKSISSFKYIAVVLMLFIFIYSLLGMQLFAGRFEKYPYSNTRFNYDNFTWAFFTTFEVLTLQNWNYIFYDF